MNKSSSVICPHCGELLTLSYDQDTVPPPPPSNRKVAFVIGHTETDKGAYSEHLKKSEWDFWKTFYMTYLTNYGTMFLHDKNISSYTQRQVAMGERTKGFDLVFELHFNAGVPEATGSEVLYYKGNELTKKLSEVYLQSLCAVTGLKNRGAKGIDSGNGYGFLQHQTPPALLLEPFFGSNPNDVLATSTLALVGAIMDTINAFYE